MKIMLLNNSKAIERLQIDLSVRKDNFHPGSGLGGNASGFFYLLSKKVRLAEPTSGEIKFTERNNKVYVSFPDTVDLKDLRLAFDEFFKNLPDKVDYTESQISDVNFLSNLDCKCDNIYLLIKSLRLTNQLVDSLDYQRDFMNKIDLFFQKELDEVSVLFLKEMDLPPDHFSSRENEVKNGLLDLSEEDFNKLSEEELSELAYCGDDESELRATLNNHPIWGKRKQEILARKDAMISNLLSQSDIDKLVILDSLPLAISFFAIRSRLTIERIVCHSLDEVKEFKTLNRVNEIDNLEEE